MAVMMMSTSAMLGGLQALPAHRVVSGTQSRLATSLVGRVRCQGLADAVDKVTKKTITKDDILRNQETNESEKKSVMGTEPTSGAPWPRPEVERRPETGSKSFFSVFAFGGAAPETINCRLAMLGFAWAVVAERMTGLTVLEQVTIAGQPGLFYFLAAVQLVTYASLVPIMGGESSDARSLGPSQRWRSGGTGGSPWWGSWGWSSPSTSATLPFSACWIVAFIRHILHNWSCRGLREQSS